MTFSDTYIAFIFVNYSLLVTTVVWEATTMIKFCGHIGKEISNCCFFFHCGMGLKKTSTTRESTTSKRTGKPCFVGRRISSVQCYTMHLIFRQTAAKLEFTVIQTWKIIIFISFSRQKIAVEGARDQIDSSLHKTETFNISLLEDQSREKILTETGSQACKTQVQL